MKWSAKSDRAPNGGNWQVEEVTSIRKADSHQGAAVAEAKDETIPDTQLAEHLVFIFLALLKIITVRAHVFGYIPYMPFYFHLLSLFSCPMDTPTNYSVIRSTYARGALLSLIARRNMSDPILTCRVQQFSSDTIRTPQDMLNGAAASCNRQASPIAHTTNQQSQQRPHKRKRRDNNFDRQKSPQKGDRTNTSVRGGRNSTTTIINVGLLNIASPSSGLTEEKFMNLIDYARPLNLHAIVILEHHLPSTDTPAYVARQGWTMHITLGPPRRGAVGVPITEASPSLFAIICSRWTLTPSCPRYTKLRFGLSALRR